MRENLAEEFAEKFTAIFLRFARTKTIGNGRNTVSRVLFQKRKLTEFCSKLGEFCKKLGEFAFAHKE